MYVGLASDQSAFKIAIQTHLLNLAVYPPSKSGSVSRFAKQSLINGHTASSTHQHHLGFSVSPVYTLNTQHTTDTHAGA